MSFVFILAAVRLFAFASSSEVEHNAECSLEQRCPHSATVLMQIKTQQSKGDANMDTTRHHDTFEEACRACQSASPGEVCFAGGCGDASGKFCWTCDDSPPGDFKRCSPDSSSLLFLNTGQSEHHRDAHTSNGERKNVLGTSLQSCSTKGTALTGFSRNGKCEDEGGDDAGSHHICIKMKADFCTVTGQSNWCGEDMPCMGQEGDCKIDHWCVCQWAFADYLQSAGGCDQIVDLVCEATNMAAFKAYEKSGEPSHQAALSCIRSKCGSGAQ